MTRTRTGTWLKFGLLALGSCYLLWYGAVQFSNFRRDIPEYQFVPLSADPAAYEKVRMIDPALAERMKMEQQVSPAGKRLLSGADERALKWLVAKRFPFLPRTITRFTISSADDVAILVRRVPWGAVRRFQAGKDSHGWFLFLGNGHSR